MHRGADVVHEPGKGELLGAEPAARGGLRLAHHRAESSRCEDDGGREPVGAGADHDRIGTHRRDSSQGTLKSHRRDGSKQDGDAHLTPGVRFVASQSL